MFTFKLKCILHKTELSDTSISYSKNKFQIFFSKTNSLFNSPSIEKEPHKTCKIFQCLHEISIPKCHRNVYKNLKQKTKTKTKTKQNKNNNNKTTKQKTKNKTKQNKTKKKNPKQNTTTTNTPHCLIILSILLCIV